MELQEALGELIKNKQPIRSKEPITTWYGRCFITLFMDDERFVRARYEKHYNAGGMAYQVDRSPLIRAAWFIGDIWEVDKAF